MLTFGEFLTPYSIMPAERIFDAAGARRDLKCVKAILKYNHAANLIRETDGATPLIQAAYWGNHEITKTLINAGATLDAKDKHSWTALMYAADRGNHEIAKTLINASAALDAKDKHGWTALMYAANNGNDAIACNLIAAGANLNIQNKYGWTALMYAVRMKHSEVVMLLCRPYAINLEIQDNDGWTALMYAQRNNERKDIADMLVSAGAKPHKSRVCSDCTIL